MLHAPSGARLGMLPDTTTARHPGATWQLIVMWRTSHNQSRNSEWDPSPDFKLRVTEELQFEIELDVLQDSVQGPVEDASESDAVEDDGMDQMNFSGLTEMTYIVKWPRWALDPWKVRTQVVRIERSSLDGDTTVTVSVDNVARLARSSSSSPSPR